MISISQFRKLCLSFPEVSESPHFEKTSFRVGKKIIVTVDEKLKRACFKLSETDQDLFSLFDNKTVYPVPNKWGKQGWTFVELSRIKKETVVDILRAAYITVAPKKLAQLIVNGKM